MQEASSSSIPAEGEGLKHLASGAGRLHLVRTILSACIRWKMKTARASQAGTRSIQQLGNICMPKLKETLTGTSKRPRPKGCTPVEKVRPPKRPKHSTELGT
jgi:hypothetical protein